MSPGHLCTLGTLPRSLPEVCGLVASLGFPNIHYVHYQGAGPDPDPRNYHLQHVILTFGSAWLPQKSAQTFLSSLRTLDSRTLDIAKKIGTREKESWMTICYSGSFYLSASLSFYNLDQYLDPCFPVKYLSSCKHSQVAKPGPARYITAITEQLSQTPWPSVIIIVTSSQVVTDFHNAAIVTA